MTAIGQKNHYNAKLLKGYGVSINLRENKICLKGGTHPFTGKQETEEWFITQIPYERIVISCRGCLSTEAVKLLPELLKVQISIVSRKETFKWYVYSAVQQFDSVLASFDRRDKGINPRTKEKMYFIDKEFNNFHIAMIGI